MTTRRKKARNFGSKLGRKTTISDLSEDLVREILSRVPLTYLTAVRATCKTWNELSRNLVLGEKAAKKQFLAFTVVDYYYNYNVRSLRFELQGIRNDDYVYEYEDQHMDYLSMKPISIPNHDQFEISKVCHCDGLLLCVSKYQSSLLVWNPYLGETRLIQSKNEFEFCDKFAFGHDKNRNYKIARISGAQNLIDVYDFRSDSWRAHNFDLDMFFCCMCVTLKGNTYFCYWNSFVGESFFVDEEKKVAVIFDIDTDKLHSSVLSLYKANLWPEVGCALMAYIIGEDGYFRSVNMGEAWFPCEFGTLVCSSYVPSLVQLHV